MDRPVEFHPETDADVQEAREWYAERSPEAAAAFGTALTEAVEHIRADPLQWPPHRFGTRQYLLHHFPFLVVYRETETAIQVVAVDHARRRPGYRRKRLSS